MNLKKNGYMLQTGLLVIFCSIFIHGIKANAQNAVRPRIIATTDGEIDDRCSMVRFLMYANEWEIEGIIHCSSRFHWAGQRQRRLAPIRGPDFLSSKQRPDRQRGYLVCLGDSKWFRHRHFQGVLSLGLEFRVENRNRRRFQRGGIANHIRCFEKKSSR